MTRRPRIEVHHTIETIAEFAQRTADNKTIVHSVTTTTRHSMYVVSSSQSGFIIPGSIVDIADRDEAIAEARRRADGQRIGPPVLSTDQEAIVRLLTLDKTERQRTIDDLSAYWRWLFDNARDDQARRLSQLIRALEHIA